MCFLTTTFRNAPAHPPPPVLIDQSLRKKKELIMPISARAHDKLKQQYTSCEYLFVAKHIFSSLLRGEGEEGGGLGRRSPDFK